MMKSMKKKKRAFLVLLMTVLLFGLSTSCQAATSKQYKTWVKNNLVKSYGTFKEGTYKTKTKYTDAYGGIGKWCKKKGVISAYATDLNGDKKKECFVIYVKNKTVSYGGTSKALHIAMLSSKGGKIIKTADVTVNNIDWGSFYDLKVWLKTNGKKKYLVLESSSGTGGGDYYIDIFHVTAGGKLSLNKEIRSSYAGDTSLSQLNAKGIINDLTVYGEFMNEKTVYVGQSGATPDKLPIFGKKLNAMLKPYGIVATVQRDHLGSRDWRLKKGSGMKSICSLKCICMGYNGGYTYTYTVKDYTDFQ